MGSGLLSGILGPDGSSLGLSGNSAGLNSGAEGVYKGASSLLEGVKKGVVEGPGTYEGLTKSASRSGVGLVHTATGLTARHFPEK